MCERLRVGIIDVILRHTAINGLIIGTSTNLDLNPVVYHLFYKSTTDVVDLGA